MLLERTITTLQSRAETPERAEEIGKLGFIQWLALMKSGVSYNEEAARALRLAQPFEATDPGVAAFCTLVRKSLSPVPQPLDLSLPSPRRKGGARERRRLL